MQPQAPTHSWTPGGEFLLWGCPQGLSFPPFKVLGTPLAGGQGTLWPVEAQSLLVALGITRPSCLCPQVMGGLRSGTRGQEGALPPARMPPPLPYPAQAAYSHSSHQAPLRWNLLLEASLFSGYRLCTPQGRGESDSSPPRTWPGLAHGRYPEVYEGSREGWQCGGREHTGSRPWRQLCLPRACHCPVLASGSSPQ